MLNTTEHTLYYVVTVVLCCMVPVHAGAGDLTAQSVLSQIRDRQAKVRSAKFIWDEDVFEAKGSRTDLIKDVSGQDFPSQQKKGPTPPEDLEYTHSYSFSFDGPKTNFVSELLTFDASNNQQRSHTRRVFDGVSQKQLRDPWSGREYPQGRIYKDREPNRDLSLLVLEPVIQCYRLPIPDNVLQGQNGFELDAVPIEIRGAATVSLSTRTERLKRVLFLDQDRLFLPIRFSLESNGALLRQTDFEYHFDEKSGWVLSGWSITKFATDGAVSQRFKSSVKEAEINTTFNNSEFEITFPPGTLVDDLKQEEAFIQRPSGGRRPISRSEFQTPYQELLATDPPVVRVNKQFERTFLVNGVVLVIVVTYFYMRRRRRVVSRNDLGSD